MPRIQLGILCSYGPASGSRYYKLSSSRAQVIFLFMSNAYLLPRVRQVLLLVVRRFLARVT